MGKDDQQAHPRRRRTLETRSKRAAQERGDFPEPVDDLGHSWSALERREWPRTEAEIHLLRSAMFAAQAIIRDMERTGREDEIQEISRNISEVAPELPGKSANDLQVRANFGSEDV